MNISKKIRQINSKKFDFVVRKLRSFCYKKKFIEMHTQNRLSILAACEDPSTISTFNYAGNIYPLPQTGQMWLEYELLNNKNEAGFFCLSTSYRNEKNPVPERHDLIFPMFEFELKGDIQDLINFEQELLQYLGFKHKHEIRNYKDIAKQYNVKELTHEHENKMLTDIGPIVFLKNFPLYTSPFWNMKKNKDFAAKVDVIIHGIETIGSAERSTNKDEMYDMFHSISDGEYANLLYDHFGHKRVNEELDAFTSMDFFTRCGGGIGLTRLISAMEKSNLFEKKE